VVNEKNEILFFNRLPLINATSLSLSSLVDLIHENNGLAVASHIDRESFSVISQLGFIPDGLPLDAVEISFRITSEERTQSLLPANRYAVVSFSDSHHVKDIGRRITEFTLEEPTVEEISLCFRGRGQRNISILY
jgi:PHP family Zn ribbon phosphoesterase